MHQCKRHAEIGWNKKLKTKKREEKSGMPCSRPGSLPHAAASSTRLEFKESQQRQLFGPSNIGLLLGFPRDPPSPGAPLLRKDLPGIAEQRTVPKMGTWGCSLPGWAVSPSRHIHISQGSWLCLFFPWCQDPCTARFGMVNGTGEPRDTKGIDPHSWRGAAKKN